MKFGSLFTGIGGFDLGFEQSGLKCQWQVEINADCHRVLDNRWPSVERFKDVSTVGQLPTVDVICGGFPCQDLSVAGKRAGLAGERSGLWFEFLRIIKSNFPRWIVIENVPGLLSSDEGRDFAAILRGLVECGYCLAWRIFDAQYDGVAQRRRRVFIVGSLGDGSCAEILFESESVPWNPPTRREAGPGVASAVTTGTGKSSGPRNGNGDPINLLYHENIDGKVYGSEQCPTLRDFQKDAPMIAATLDQRGRGPTDAVMMNLQVTHALRSEGADASEDGTGRGTPIIAAPLTANYGKQLDNSDRNGGPPNLIAFSSKDHGADAGEIAPTLRAQNFDKSHINGGGQVAVAYSANDYANMTFEQTERARPLTNSPDRSRAAPVALNGFGVRRLTPRECERLQGFPDDWTLYDASGKEISDSARYRMLGNAVAVPVAKWIGKRVMQQGEKG